MFRVINAMFRMRLNCGNKSQNAVRQERLCRCGYRSARRCEGGGIGVKGEAWKADQSVCTGEELKEIKD